MGYRSFFGFGPAPEAGGMEPMFPGFVPGETEDKEGYFLPVRRGDIIKIITAKVPVIDNSLLILGIVDINTLALVTEVAGTIQNMAGSTQLYVTASVPSNLPNGCYQFLMYTSGQGMNYGDWVETGRECEEVNGQLTGYVIITEERTVTPAGGPQAVYISNPFRVGPHLNTRLLAFRNDRNAFYFDYQTNVNFEQQIRLPVMLNRDERPVQESVYRQSNGIRRFGTVSIDKKWKLVTEYLDERVHDALIIALKHSRVKISTNTGGEFKYFFAVGGMDYEDQETFTNNDGWYELKRGTIELWEQGFNQQNSTCGYNEAEGQAPDVLPDNGGIFEGVFE